MKIVNEVPAEGNFIAMWEHGGCIWADSFLTSNGAFLIYQKHDDDGNMTDDWVTLNPDHHPAFNYNPPGGVSNRCYIVKE